VLSPEEVRQVLSQLDGKYWIAGNRLYGSGLRLRGQDIEFGMSQVNVRAGKGKKDRVTILPDAVVEPLKLHLEKIRTLHTRDLDRDLGRVYKLVALTRKLPKAAFEWPW